jgi:adenylate cyclase
MNMSTQEATAESREPLPVTKRLAIIFADLVGTSSVAATVGNLVVAGALQAFFRRVDDLQIVYHGRIMKAFGDGFLALFEDVVPALHFATALQRPLAQEPLLAGQRLALRISLHRGAVTLVRTSYGDDAFGTNINVAAHLESPAQPGQIVVTEAVYQELPTGQQARLGPREHVAVKGVREPVAFRRLDVGGGE